jgi:4-hydroxy-2-oxoheptanedioate aldolase
MTPEYAQKMISKGFQFVTVGSDQKFMTSGAKSTLEKLKKVKSKEESKAY